MKVAISQEFKDWRDIIRNDQILNLIYKKTNWGTHFNHSVKNGSKP